MNLLQGLYSLGLKTDRYIKEQTKQKLSFPVISVGNISVGGRAKTPFVVELCQYLREKNYEPVVLTRGYARKSRKDVWLLPETLPHIQKITVDDCGDEAVEIYLRAKVAVLISSNRVAQAKKFIQHHETLLSGKKHVFILDDGFQHWRLARDVDVVIINNFDKSDTLLPTGRLREEITALDRADVVFNLNTNLSKELSVQSKGLDPESCCAITTRAGSQIEYSQELNKHLKFSVPILNFRDHLQADLLREKIYQLSPNVKQLVLGMKEAVKLVSPQELLEGGEGPYPLQIRDRSYEVFIARLDLKWEKESLEKAFRKKGIL